MGSEAFLISKEADFLTNVSLFGLYNSRNYHSWRYSTPFSFSTCLFCEKIVYPLSAAVQCLSCRKRAHRCCTKSCNPLCEGFGCKICTSNEYYSKLPIPSTVPGIIIVAHTGKEESWNSIFEYVRSDFMYRSNSASINELSNLNNTSRLEHFCKSLLFDPSTFPGKMAVICSSTFMNLRFSSFGDLCLHCRSCLDTVSSAMVLELEKKYSIDADCRRVISTVDEYVVSNSKHKVYKRIMSACRLRTQSADNELIEIVHREREVSHDSSSSSSDINLIGSSCIVPLTYEISPLKKCSMLSRLLHQIVVDSSIEKEGDKSDIDIEGVDFQCQINADELLPKVARVIKEIVNSGLEISWHAECKYITSMCNESFLLGDKGYSLATVMQALKLISSSK